MRSSSTSSCKRPFSAGRSSSRSTSRSSSDTQNDPPPPAEEEAETRQAHEPEKQVAARRRPRWGQRVPPPAADSVRASHQQRTSGAPPRPFSAPSSGGGSAANARQPGPAGSLQGRHAPAAGSAVRTSVQQRLPFGSSVQTAAAVELGLGGGRGAIALTGPSPKPPIAVAHSISSLLAALRDATNACAEPQLLGSAALLSVAKRTLRQVSRLLGPPQPSQLDEDEAGDEVGLQDQLEPAQARALQQAVVELAASALAAGPLHDGIVVAAVECFRSAEAKMAEAAAADPTNGGRGGSGTAICLAESWRLYCTVVRQAAASSFDASGRRSTPQGCGKSVSRVIAQRWFSKNAHSWPPMTAAAHAMADSLQRGMQVGACAAWDDTEQPLGLSFSNRSMHTCNPAVSEGFHVARLQVPNVLSCSLLSHLDNVEMQ
ncbi:hypothetical protein PLESTB_001228400 [Pleodorina starrii]|uniref:Uncharacterized protein n=1 Tax=Pleodorina starrii TaxID=330485 RepID=A0A9W6F5W9_9CHLO|nr:hypothetical protein PLESTM_000936400 [Pleodorina starrii]GLC57449.1 hypothetical protein PLESTB_001228400 [Pleodorina starrii]GLC77207.1 hypothetical protein PLESTF_001898200 [Pleodorina starrii]